MRLAALLVVLAGCSGFIEKRAASTTYSILEKSQVAARREADVEIARAALPGGLMQIEAFALAYPWHRGFQTMRAEVLCQYATGFVFDDWEDASLAAREGAEALAARVERLTARCIEANLALLPAAWRSARAQGGAAWLALLPKARRAHADALRWIATSEAVLLALAPMQRIATLPVIEATLARSIELAPGAHDSDAELMLGTLQAGRSRFLGGDDGTAMFAAARAQLGAGGLIADVMFARGVAVARQDRALFTATLQRVLAADLAAWPERRLANELARIKAQRYLAAIDALIPAS
ncbi:MAG: hypothetical protein JNL83_37470 [Myxococcales bacterium]|nr:hypothetical protein [Myxococcales bacterium]